MFPVWNWQLKPLKPGAPPDRALCRRETAVDCSFRSCKFTDIARIVAGVMTEHQNICDPALDDIMNVDSWQGQSP